MIENFSFNKKNTAVAVGVKFPDNSINEINFSLNELKFLAKTLNVVVVKFIIQPRDKINPNYFIGIGKLEEIKNYVDENNIDTILFDNELNGIQERNLEKYLNKAIFGRTELILHIFNKRAKTKEAKLQVQLAFLEYMKPRLKNRWDHFSRVEGGIGMRGGEGEKQLELDRRMIDNQIDKIKKRLKEVDSQMKNRRKRRLNENIVSLVGYTNAGKSTLFNLLAKSTVYTENMLFSTLASTTRRVYLTDNLFILLNDTVGFINKLPHSLVASFKSTLDEILSSKLIIHVIDVNAENIENNINSVNNVLNEIGANEIPIINVFNKIDLSDNNSHVLYNDNADNIYISALKKIGIDNLKERIINYFDKNLN